MKVSDTKTDKSKKKEKGLTETNLEHIAKTFGASSHANFRLWQHRHSSADSGWFFHTLGYFWSSLCVLFHAFSPQPGIGHLYRLRVSLPSFASMYAQVSSKQIFRLKTHCIRSKGKGEKKTRKSRLTHDQPSRACPARNAAPRHCPP